MRRAAVLLGGILAVAVVATVSLSAVGAAVPGFAPRALNPLVEAFGGVTCDDERCPPDAGWVPPADAAVTSGFRTADRPDHHGVDIATARGAPVVAASAGVVAVAECQATRDDEPYGCDRDGSAQVRGCGWYVQILHAHDRATLYCHLLEEPDVSAGDAVAAGQRIGSVGSSGNSSEPHLHFEVQEGGLFSPPRPDSAVDPEEFMARQGQPLTR